MDACKEPPETLAHFPGNIPGAQMSENLRSHGLNIKIHVSVGHSNNSYQLLNTIIGLCQM